MKALSFRQSWPELILQGRKTIDLQTYTTHYRGRLAFKPLTLTPVNLSRPKPMLHENTGKAACVFWSTFPLFPKTLPGLLEQTLPRFLQRQQNQTVKINGMIHVARNHLYKLALNCHSFGANL